MTENDTFEEDSDHFNKSLYRCLTLIPDIDHTKFLKHFPPPPPPSPKISQIL